MYKASCQRLSPIRQSRHTWGRVSRYAGSVSIRDARELWGSKIPSNIRLPNSLLQLTVSSGAPKISYYEALNQVSGDLKRWVSGDSLFEDTTADIKYQT